ncbi:hypothetical protein V8E52_000673 [Russula decolorans]
MTSAATMARDIGTLIVVILKARNLPNKRQFGKQDPYCVVVLNGESRKTKIIKRGGQHPEWDEEIRFTIYEDEDDLNASDDGSPPPLPPKAGRGPKKIQGGETMALACFAADKEPELIGETMVDLNEVLTKGETDEWFTLHNKDKYCGEVYLELTFWSNEPRPEKKATPKFAKVNKQYGGPGVFVPSESPGHHQQGSGSSHDSHRRDSFSSSVFPSNSSVGIDLYKPAYEQTVRAHAPHSSSVDELVNDMGELVFDQRRRDTFPPMQSGFSSRSVSTSGHSAALSSSSLAFPVSESPSHDTPIATSPHRAVTPSGQRPHRYSLASSQSYEISQYQPAYEPSPPPRTVYHTPPRHGPRYSLPAASSGFIPVSSKFGSPSHSHHCAKICSHTHTNTHTSSSELHTGAVSHSSTHTPTCIDLSWFISVNSTISSLECSPSGIQSPRFSTTTIAPSCTTFANVSYSFTVSTTPGPPGCRPASFWSATRVHFYLCSSTASHQPCGIEPCSGVATTASPTTASQATGSVLYPDTCESSLQSRDRSASLTVRAKLAASAHLRLGTPACPTESAPCPSWTPWTPWTWVPYTIEFLE